MFLECLLGAVIIACLLIIISIILGVDSHVLAEHMTRIRRTVGTYNSGNDQQVAPGMIDSMAIMDYRHTWTDGVHVFSCDECPNKQSCPHCPQYKLSPIQSMVGGESPDHGSGNVTEPNADMNADMNADITANSTHANGDFSRVELDMLDKFDPPNMLGPAYDLDPDFVSSRSRMGASCSSLPRKTMRGMTYDVTDLGTKNDDLFDGERSTGQVSIARGASGCPTGKSSLKLLYTNVMGLANPPPYEASCEFLGAQGYLYKETCALGI